MTQATAPHRLTGSTGHRFATPVQSVIPFTLTDGPGCGILVHVLEYATFSVIQLTNIGGTAITLTDLIVDGEFRPVFRLAALLEEFVPLRLPLEMPHGYSLGVLLSDCGKRPETIRVCTSHGEFGFRVRVQTKRLIKSGGE